MKLELCDTFFKKATGLMFRSKLIDSGLLFDFGTMVSFSIHNFFVFQETNLVFFDSEKHIVEVKEGFKPFMLYFPRRKYRYMAEVPVSFKDFRTLVF